MPKDEAKKRKKSTDSDVDNNDENKKKARTSTSSTTTATKVVPSYEERCLAVNAISYPLANKKSTKKCHKLVRKASTNKQIRRGVKEVIKGIRKGETGLVILAGDIYPIDVISHIPLLLESKNIPYLFVPSKFDLGAAASTKRPTSCVLIKSSSLKKNKSTDNDSDDFQELYDALYKEALEYDPSTIVKRDT